MHSENTDSLQKLTFADKMELAISFLTELENLHNKGFVHGDLTFKNIIYNPKSNQLKMIDAGNMENADENSVRLEISFAKEMILLLFTTNKANKFNDTNYWNEEYQVRKIFSSSPIIAELNGILAAEYHCVSDLKLSIEENYGKYLNKTYKDQMSKVQLLGEIQVFKESFANMKGQFTFAEQHRLGVFFKYLDNMCSAFKDDKINETSARAVYDFLTAQINTFFEDSLKNSTINFVTPHVILSEAKDLPAVAQFLK